MRIYVWVFLKHRLLNCRKKWTRRPPLSPKPDSARLTNECLIQGGTMKFCCSVVFPVAKESTTIPCAIVAWTFPAICSTPILKTCGPPSPPPPPPRTTSRGFQNFQTSSKMAPDDSWIDPRLTTKSNRCSTNHPISC